MSRADGPGPWRKNLSCGEISKFCTWNMWRKLKFVHMWINFKFLHMTDVEKSKISFILCTIYGILLHFTLFWWKTFFRWQFTLFCRKSILRFTHFCVEKNLAKNSARGEKMTNMRYGWKSPTIHIIPQLRWKPHTMTESDMPSALGLVVGPIGYRPSHGFFIIFSINNIISISIPLLADCR